ncbi:hypothetical protein CDAR_69941 [Caerostris darwini]|uniref:Uncharacterized protein n=1 Tax=Caerostris darwini TaxID=1538125 RepID=A0AAV4T4V4_9ARAC|nr:hypothetical protein CDAR_69941 [Caerostris darwini]
MQFAKVGLTRKVRVPKKIEKGVRMKLSFALIFSFVMISDAGAAAFPTEYANLTTDAFKVSFGCLRPEKLHTLRKPI